MTWIAVMVLSMILFKFTRPVNYLASAFDVIVPLAI